jgi:prepilin-type N-terminal cleavage/methylation domain-containing protein
MRNSHPQAPLAGFTLIELSIVLVIIGLIVGGVLVGRDLIRASEIRSTIGQLEKYTSAVNTFRTKYNGIPGDLPRAATFGFAARAGSYGRGDGNRLVEGAETVLFWRDLSDASLVDGSYTLAADAASASYAAATLPQLFPATKLNSGIYIVAIFLTPGGGSPLIYGNDWVIAGFSGGFGIDTSVPATNGYANVSNVQNPVTPFQALQIDTKMDDAKPITGIVQVRNNPFAVAAQPLDGYSVSATDCFNFAGGAFVYLLQANLAENPTCRMIVSMR